MSDASISETVVALLTGGASALIIGGAAAEVSLRLRGRNFRRHKADPAPRPDWFPGHALPPRSEGDQIRDRAMREELATRHSEAKALQDRTFAQLIATSATLLTALVVTVLGVTVGHDSAWLHLYSGAFDVVALTVAYLAFRRSGSIRAEWLRRRAVTELLRQWLTVEYLLAKPEAAITTRVAELNLRFESAIGGKANRLIAQVAEIGEDRLAEISQSLSTSELSVDALTTYYVARPQRQVDWFGTSLQRIESSHHRRARIIAATFVAAILAANVKLVALLIHQEVMSDTAMMALLILIGLSGASSSAYLGQNQRSLKHRYNQQLRAIKNWVRSSQKNGAMARMSGVETQTDKVVQDIVAFERLMLIELLDWLAISIDDAMELAPS